MSCNVSDEPGSYPRDNLMYSTSEGVHGSWLLSKTFTDNCWHLIWDEANSKWWHTLLIADPGDASKFQSKIYDLTDITDYDGTATLRSTEDHIVYPSRIIEGGKMLCGIEHRDNDDIYNPLKTFNTFGYYDLSGYSMSAQATVVRADEGPLGLTHFPAEPYVFRRGSTDNKLMMLTRWFKAGTTNPENYYTYQECMDEYEATNEGINKDTGTITSAAANKLIDSGAAWTTTVPVAVGWQVWNITNGTRTTVTAVDSATQLSLAADIFPADDGDAYELSCWGPAVTCGMTYYYRGQQMRAFWYAGFLWLAGTARIYETPLPRNTFIAKVDDTNTALITERNFLGWSGYQGNGDIDAKSNRVGNLWLDIVEPFGPLWYLQIDSGEAAQRRIFITHV